MRYKKAEEVIQCALMMQAARQGITIRQIAERFGIAHRSAQRLRDAVVRTFPQIEEETVGGGVKRYCFPSRSLDGLADVSADELADLETTIACLKSCNRLQQAESLERLKTRIHASLADEECRRLETDIAALLEAEGLAQRPLPKPEINTDHLHTLRHAIKACTKVILTYRNRKSGEVAEHDVLPYGFLYGMRHYLVCHTARESENPWRLYCLSNVQNVTDTEEPFSRDETFNLQEFAARSFGTWQEAPQEVEWKFTPQAAENAREFVFHPDQTMEELDDGSLIVRFTAGGFMEMAWHLYTWGDQVEVLAPQSLAKMTRNAKKQWPGMP